MFYRCSRKFKKVILSIKYYFNTVRKLKTKQIFFQILRRIYRSKIKESNSCPELREKITNKYFLNHCHNKISMTGATDFIFYGEKGNLIDHGWDAENKSKLWLYNLHYFNDLNSIDSETREDWHVNLVQDWIKNNPKDSLGYEPYPLSIRIVNWIKWDLRVNKLDLKAQRNLFSQGILLNKSIEYHILGNHLFTNAKALFFLGSYFKGQIASKWLKNSIKILVDQINEQVLEDGGSFELSPMYHCIFIQDLLDILNLLKLYDLENTNNLEKLLNIKIPIMLNWLDAVTFNENELTNFNDSASNISPSPKQLQAYAKSLQLKINKKNYEQNQDIDFTYLKNSGYINVKSNETKIIIDVAKLGPDYLLAHGHADTLSFEMNHKDKHFFINSGTSTYELNDRRNFERSTMAHNTVEINNKSSSEVWSSFRVAKRAYPIDLNINKIHSKLLKIQCSHDGYQKIIHNDIKHIRSWDIEPNCIRINDRVTGQYKKAISRFILDPFVEIIEINQNEFDLYNGSVELKFLIKKGECQLVPWKCTRKFGSLESTRCFEINIINGENIVEIIS